MSNQGAPSEHDQLVWMVKRVGALERALVRISQEAEVLWDTMGGMPVYPELADLGKAILDSREVLVDQSEAEREPDHFEGNIGANIAGERYGPPTEEGK